MRVPISWLKDFVDITIPLPDLARRLTIAGLEVEQILSIGLSFTRSASTGQRGDENLESYISGLAWEPDKIVTASVSEVMPHPNADRLVLCKLFDGEREHVVLTGAPNLYPYKGIGPLLKPLKVAYARQGAHIYDGHQPGQVLTTLKPAKIRGIDSYSMICSEKELGISDDHEGVIIFDEDAPVGVPLADYIGDAVMDIKILPNIARDANILGVAREISALTGVPMHIPDDFYEVKAEGTSIASKVAIEITTPKLNPRFVLGLIQDVTIKPSPYWMQLRLKLAGMRPINNIVDVTNYVMLEVGEPLHAFDYDILLQRAGSKSPTILTRTALPGERLTTLDGVDRLLDPFTVLVCDTAGSLSIAGVMGGAESEVYEATQPASATPADSSTNHTSKRTKSTSSILLEGAAWNNINNRKTAGAQKLQSEAAFRFSRGVHPAMAERGVKRGLKLMQQLSGGTVSKGLVDNYPLRPVDPVVELTSEDVQRMLGIKLTPDEIVKILQSLDFKCELLSDGESPVTIRAHTPDHRMDISEGLVGKADLLEEIARIYGYERIPETRLASELPPQRSNPTIEGEERVVDILVDLGLQEIVSHRQTTPERESRRLAPGTRPDDQPYLRIINPIASDRIVMRHSVLNSLLETLEHNSHIRPRMALFEEGPIFLASEAGERPDELHRLSIVLTGPRTLHGWQKMDADSMDFYDLKGILTALMDALHIEYRVEPSEHPSFHPGKCAQLMVGEQKIGVFGELHPLVHSRYDLSANPVEAADINLDLLVSLIPVRYDMQPVPAFPPVLEDLAIVVDEGIPADRVASVIKQGGGRIVTAITLFDVYRSEQIGKGKKSLAYSLTYQSAEKTLTDNDVAQVRGRIVHRLEQELDARLRA
ncbi:MAG TPA: phenylalanine--tRNA ligase subunit beta [Anaerolineales bacterium]|nr:phenylalanine--tRNA ligase subunit beta [Anaerolineales bacterium]